MRIAKCLSVLCFVSVVAACSSFHSGKDGSEPKHAFSDYQYNAETKVLTVTFTNGSAYNYADVPAGVFSQIDAAESKGAVFNDLVKGKFTATKIDK